MKKVLLILPALVIAAAYYAWPFYGLHQISRAVARRDGAELAQRSDREALKRSLGDQIGRTYLRITGKDKELKDFQIAVAVRVAASLASGPIDALVTPEGLLELLDKSGSVAYGRVGLPTSPQLPNFRNLSRVFSNTERFGRDFSIVLPLSADEQTGYRLQLRLENWTWKLSGVGLPEARQIALAQEIAKLQPR
ncbi:DUF2939 domain-containing protein [Rhodoplanes sp. Z2-YC6860]|uniref:DUF2939 domain-containing protein n=1 Tax=Rhodoplanes sp. Z2-YC6860 TaxID=674703 RepID=UPI00078BA4A0|nr:DUF2939 domain-containing protein [Rhodoplanes sp. Z2-YC6860]AMN43707.1 hypothetical protein RHPLAN_52890 [Rhodoplanes sp. Z2-YC6860]